MLMSACDTTRMPLPLDTFASAASQSTITVVHYDPENFLIRRGRQNPLQSGPGLLGMIGQFLTVQRLYLCRRAGAPARLIRLHDEEILWQGRCSYWEKDARTPSNVF